MGDYVSLSYLTNVFTHDFDQKWTGEIFKIVRRYPRHGLPISEVEDFNGEKVAGTMYEPELQKVNINEDNIFKIDKILK